MNNVTHVAVLFTDTHMRGVRCVYNKYLPWYDMFPLFRHSLSRGTQNIGTFSQLPLYPEGYPDMLQVCSIFPDLQAHHTRHNTGQKWKTACWLATILCTENGTHLCWCLPSVSRMYAVPPCLPLLVANKVPPWSYSEASWPEKYWGTLVLLKPEIEIYGASAQTCLAWIFSVILAVLFRPLYRTYYLNV